MQSGVSPQKRQREFRRKQAAAAKNNPLGKAKETAMTLAEYFREQYIFLFSSLDAKSVPVVRPRLLAPVSDARSVVFAAIPYFVKEEASNLAMFARARDYHAYSAALGAGAASVLHERHPGCAVSGFADHSPYSEVQGAAMAGIGVMGENGLLITKPYSSFVFL